MAIDKVVLLISMGVLSRPFFLAYLCAKKKRNFFVIFCLLLALVVDYIIAYFIVSFFYNDVFLNQVVKTFASLFYSFCIFTPFLELYNYLKICVINNKVNLSKFLALLILCALMIAFNNYLM